MTGRLPAERVPAAPVTGAGSTARPAPSRRDRAFLIALWQILVSMGAPFVPPPFDVDDDSHDPGRSDAR